MQEIWKDIEGFEGYQISNLGRVKSLSRLVKARPDCKDWQLKERILKLAISKKGYYRIRLKTEKRNSSFTVHRLVAIAFITNPHNKPQINHIDSNRLNNHASNLEWATASENQIHSVMYGFYNRTKRAKRRSNRKLTDSQVIELKKHRSNGLTYRELGLKYSISGKMAEQIIKGIKYKTNV